MYLILLKLNRFDFNLNKFNNKDIYISIKSFIIKIVEVYDGHTLSCVLLRGSIPIFWSQPGLKYRPPPQLDRSIKLMF